MDYRKTWHPSQTLKIDESIFYKFFQKPFDNFYLVFIKNTIHYIYKRKMDELGAFFLYKLCEKTLELYFRPLL